MSVLSKLVLVLSLEKNAIVKQNGVNHNYDPKFPGNIQTVLSELIDVRDSSDEAYQFSYVFLYSIKKFLIITVDCLITKKLVCSLTLNYS